MRNLGTLYQVKDRLRRFGGGIARELQEQRRQAVRSLGVVALHPALAPGCVLETHFSLSGECTCSLGRREAVHGTLR